MVDVEATKAFMEIFWELLRDSDFRALVKSITKPRRENKPKLMSRWAWWYCVWKTDKAEAAKKRIEIANDEGTAGSSLFHPTSPLPATELWEYLMDKCSTLPSVDPRDHDLNGDDQYDSGYCQFNAPNPCPCCPGWRTDLIDGMCRHHRL